MPVRSSVAGERANGLLQDIGALRGIFPMDGGELQHPGHGPGSGGCNGATTCSWCPADATPDVLALEEVLLGVGYCAAHGRRLSRRTSAGLSAWFCHHVQEVGIDEFAIRTEMLDADGQMIVADGGADGRKGRLQQPFRVLCGFP